MIDSTDTCFITEKTIKPSISEDKGLYKQIISWFLSFTYIGDLELSPLEVRQTSAYISVELVKLTVVLLLYTCLYGGVVLAADEPDPELEDDNLG